MITRAQRVRLGIFVLMAVSVLVISIIIIVAPKLLENRDTYFIAFEDVSVTGLQEGSAVKYQGLQVGYISDISIDPDNIRRVILKVSLEEGTPIKVDTKAEIAFLGITGLKLIELRSGSNEAANLPPGSFIQSGRSLSAEITGRADVLTQKVELVLNNLVELTNEQNSERLLSLVDTVGTAIGLFNSFIRRNEDTFYSALENTEEFTEELDSLTFYSQRILKSIDAFATSDTLHQIINNFAAVTDELKQAELVQLFKEINITLAQTNNMLQDVEISFAKSRTDLVYTIERMRDTVDYLNQFARLISEDPSVLVRGAEPKNAPDFELE